MARSEVGGITRPHFGLHGITVTYSYMHRVFSSLGEGEMRGRRLNEVYSMTENPFLGNWWREESLARYRGAR